MSKHPITVKDFPGTLTLLAVKASSLRYDAQAKIFREYALCQAQEAKEELGRDRPQLATSLARIAQIATSLTEELERAFAISRTHMREALEKEPLL